MGKLPLQNKKLLSKFWPKEGKAQEMSDGLNIYKILVSLHVSEVV